MVRETGDMEWTIILIDVRAKDLIEGKTVHRKWGKPNKNKKNTAIKIQLVQIQIKYGAVSDRVMFEL